MSIQSCLINACDRVHTSENNTKVSEQNAKTYANAAQRNMESSQESSALAVNAANIAKSVVIPTDATYSIDAIDSISATMANLILENRQDIEKLNLGVEA